MKIITNRCWELETKAEGDCFEIKEIHEGGDEQQPYIVVPVEAVDEVVYQLLKFKRKAGKND